MTLDNLLIILVSACVHVVAHVVLRRPGNRDARVWWLLAWGFVLFTPMLVWRWPALSLTAVGVLLLSAMFEAGYFIAIARAYRELDLSLVYPLARGSAPVWLVVWSAMILSEPTPPGGLVGIALIVCGLYVSNLPSLGAWLRPLEALRHNGPRWALLAGLFISLYTATDRVGITLVEPLPYTVLALGLTALVMLPLTVRAVGWPQLHAEGRREWRSNLVAGFTTVAAYGLVLVAIQRGLPTSYAGATREASVALATAIGIFWFKEAGPFTRWLGAALIVAGVAGLKLFG
jgi:drug/metabolite transporter (DMT)-like permease